MRRVCFAVSVKQTLRMSCAPLADRKSTRLNSSHSQISYAVFCLKKKKHTKDKKQHAPGRDAATANMTITHCAMRTFNKNAAIRNARPTRSTQRPDTPYVV